MVAARAFQVLHDGHSGPRAPDEVEREADAGDLVPPRVGLAADQPDPGLCGRDPVVPMRIRRIEPARPRFAPPSSTTPPVVWRYVSLVGGPFPVTIRFASILTYLIALPVARPPGLVWPTQR